MANDLTLFDYAGLPVDLATALQIHADRIAVSYARIEDEALAIGRELVEAQSKMARPGCGNFVEWVERATPVKSSQAYRLIDYAKAPENRRLSPRGERRLFSGALA